MAQIGSGIELARGRLGGDAWVAMLICGTIAATGGGELVTFISCRRLLGR